MGSNPYNNRILISSKKALFICNLYFYKIILFLIQIIENESTDSGLAKEFDNHNHLCCKE